MLMGYTSRMFMLIVQVINIMILLLLDLVILI